MKKYPLFCVSTLIRYVCVLTFNNAFKPMRFQRIHWVYLRDLAGTEGKTDRKACVSKTKTTLAWEGPEPFCCYKSGYGNRRDS